MTPLQLRKNRLYARMTQKEIAAELDISLRFWQAREWGEEPIPKWLARAVRDLVANPSKA